jgi:hypothetical protein
VLQVISVNAISMTNREALEIMYYDTAYLAGQLLDTIWHVAKLTVGMALPEEDKGRDTSEY